MRERIRFSKNQKGITLIEVIVVILIMGILSSVTIVSLQSIYTGNVNKCAKIISSMLDNTRLEAMSRNGKVYLEISEERGKYYAEIVSSKSGEIDKQEIGNAQLEIKAIGDDNEVKVTQTNSIQIEFDKSSGAYKENIYNEIVIRGAKTTKVILVKETGRNYIE